MGLASFSVILRLAILTLTENRLRSVLTLLGMTFGTAAVIATLSSNEGAQRYISKQLEKLGTKLMTVSSQSRAMDESDAAVVRKYSNQVEAVVTETQVGSVGMRFQNRVFKAQAFGAIESYFSAMGLTLHSGRFFLQGELEGAANVVVLGHRVREELFGKASGIHQYVLLQVNGVRTLLKVVGVLKEKGSSSGGGHDTSAYIPPGLARKLSPSSTNARMLVVLKDDDKSMMVKSEVLALLGRKYESSLQISDAREAIERTKSIWSKQNFVGICLAVVSLLTGGVGIMNIMLLSIHQRQKEIGLRKAVGAQSSEIALQFLLETVLICFLGGMIGVIVGWGFGQQVAKMLGEWEAVTSGSSIALALGFSVLTGIVFGLLPALRAAKIDPYDALRTG